MAKSGWSLSFNPDRKSTRRPKAQFASLRSSGKNHCHFFSSISCVNLNLPSEIDYFWMLEKASCSGAAPHSEITHKQVFPALWIQSVWNMFRFQHLYLPFSSLALLLSRTSLLIITAFSADFPPISWLSRFADKMIVASNRSDLSTPWTSFRPHTLAVMVNGRMLRLE